MGVKAGEGGADLGDQRGPADASAEQPPAPGARVDRPGHRELAAGAGGRDLPGPQGGARVAVVGMGLVLEAAGDRVDHQRAGAARPAPAGCPHLHDPLGALGYRASGVFDDVVDAGVPLGQAIDVDQRGEYRVSRCGEPGCVAAMELCDEHHD